MKFTRLSPSKNKILKKFDKRKLHDPKEFWKAFFKSIYPINGRDTWCMTSSDINGVRVCNSRTISNVFWELFATVAKGLKRRSNDFVCGRTRATKRKLEKKFCFSAL